jgi:hypothetical protein
LSSPLLLHVNPQNGWPSSYDLLIISLSIVIVLRVIEAPHHHLFHCTDIYLTFVSAISALPLSFFFISTSLNASGSTDRRSNCPVLCYVSVSASIGSLRHAVCCFDIICSCEPPTRAIDTCGMYYKVLGDEFVPSSFVCPFPYTLQHPRNVVEAHDDRL